MASREEIFTAVIRLNDQEATGKLKKMETQLETLKKRRDEALRQGKIDVWTAASKEIDKIEKKMVRQRQLIGAMNHTLGSLSTAKQKELEQIIKDINRHLNSGAVERNSKEWKELNECLKQTKRELSVIRREATEQPGLWSRFTTFLNANWGAVTQIISGITGISTTIRSAVNDYAQMEEEMADVRKYTGMTAEQVEELNEELKKMDTRTSREELNRLAGAAGRLGITGKEEILQFVEAADMISVALGDDLGDGAVDKIGKLAMAFGEDEKKGLKGAILATGSAINELAQNSSANAGFLVEFTARVAGFGKQLGLTQAQIMGFGAVMDENLLKDEMAATAFGNMLTKMQTDTAKFAAVAGMSVTEFARLLREDANGAILALADSLKKADPQEMMKMLDGMGLDGSRAVGVLATLADKIGDVRRHQQLATEAYEEGKSVAAEYATMNQTVQARLDKCKKAFKEMTVELGERLLPVVKYTISGAGMLTKSLSVLVGWFIKYRGTIVSTATAIALLTAYRERDVIWTKLQVLWNDKLAVALAGALKSMKAMGAFIKANPWMAAITAVIALAGGIADLTRRNKEAKKAIDVVAEADREAARERASQIGTLRALYDGTQDVNKSMNERISYIRLLRQNYPDYFKDLSDEEILAGKAADAYKRLTDNIVASSKARAYQAKIDELAQQTAQLEEEIEAEQKWLDEHEAEYKRNKASSVMTGRGTRLYQAQYGGGSTAGEDFFVKKYEQAADRVIKKQEAIKENDANIKKLAAKVVENTPEPDGGSDGGTVTVPPGGNGGDRKDDELKKRLRERAEAVKAEYQAELACEMMAYRQGISTYTDYMEERHRIAQNYYDRMKAVYGEDSAEYKKLLDDRAKEEEQYSQWEAKQSELSLTVDRLLRDQAIRRQFMQQQVTDTEAMNEALFESEIEYLRQRQNLYKQGSKEWLDIETQIQMKQKERQFQLEQSWLQRLSQYREQAGLTDYQRLQEIELKGVETFYGALLEAGKMTRAEYDAIVEHIKRKYADMRAQQAASGDIQGKAAKGLDTARKNAGVMSKGGSAAANDAATGIFSITQAVSQQKAINEELKRLYGKDYENNREYQEAKRQLDQETMQQIVAGVQAAYSTINTMMSAASSYSQACSDLETAKISANYERQIEAAGSNSKKREKLEKERDAAIAKAKTKANRKAMAMEYAQAVASTAMAAINAYASAAKLPPPAGQVLPPIMAGMALAAGAIQIATIRKQHQAEAAGYYEGGFTGGRRYRREAGVVHEGEFVANHHAVNNRQLLPVLSLIDQAQRSNRVASLRAEDITNVMGGPAPATVVAPVVNVENDNAELREAIEAHRAATDMLLQQLAKPISAQVVLTGPDGLNAQQKRLNNMLRNK